MGDDPTKPAEKGLQSSRTRADLDEAALDLAAELRSRRGGDQLGLLPEDDVEEADGPLRTATSAAAGRRGKGRPPGAINKRTTEVRDYLLKHGYRHPLEVLAQFASSNVDELAAELHCDRIEAADRIIKAAKDLAPYFESALPTSVKVDSRAVHYFVAGKLDTATKAVDGGAMSIFGKVVEHQSISGSDAVRPDDEGSHESD